VAITGALVTRAFQGFLIHPDTSHNCALFLALATYQTRFKLRYRTGMRREERLAALYEAKREKKLAAEYYRKAAQFAQDSPGFDQELIEWYSSKAKELEAND
jgi:hypothetical protein